MLQGQRKAVAGPLLRGSPRKATGPVWAQSGDGAGKVGAGSETLTLPTYASQRLCLTSGDNKAIWEPPALPDTRLPLSLSPDPGLSVFLEMPWA